MALARTGGSSSWMVDANDGCGITEDYDAICWVSCTLETRDLLAAVKVEPAECWLFVGRKRSCGGCSYA
jgi:hypothetical protein